LDSVTKKIISANCCKTQHFIVTSSKPSMMIDDLKDNIFIFSGFWSKFNGY